MPAESCAPCEKQNKKNKKRIYIYIYMYTDHAYIDM